MRLSTSPSASFPTSLHYMSVWKDKGSSGNGGLSVKRKQRKERQEKQKEHERRDVTSLVAPHCHSYAVAEWKSPTAVVKYLTDDNPLHFSNIPGYPHGAVDSHSRWAHYRSASPVRLPRTNSFSTLVQLMEIMLPSAYLTSTQPVSMLNAQDKTFFSITVSC